ncbi:CDP-diacylglycerol--glycerol-3-phosphate 3-phosphatidyltransferase [Paenibacillus humicola]|uniref:CDP-diacylglycerol--glycerol-3-phosphate 3-phosphatidyltransferase n=1 Tax=Paenibacillus humicola TaxID=3110540 RepID=UPI00237AB0E2|nr:CDP-diacylglycerol--glycerol-3-phosphate 3-phosphatidyltransferase [Paenibacillus humicola]
MNLANRITVIRIGLIPIFIVLLQSYPQWLIERSHIVFWLHQYGIYAGTSLFLLASATDKLDGYIARKYNLVTNAGKLLDPLADKLLISVAFIMLVQDHLVPTWIAVAIIGRELLVTGIRIAATAQNIALAADTYGKIKMVVQVAAVAVVLTLHFPALHLSAAPLACIVMLAAAAVTLFSGYRYLKANYSRLSLHL